LGLLVVPGVPLVPGEPADAVLGEALGEALGDALGEAVGDAVTEVVNGLLGVVVGPGVLVNGAAWPGISDGEPVGVDVVNSPLPNHTAAPRTTTATTPLTSMIACRARSRARSARRVCGCSPIASPSTTRRACTGPSGFCGLACTITATHAY
jgi:hypothetical protein